MAQILDYRPPIRHTKRPVCTWCAWGCVFCMLLVIWGSCEPGDPLVLGTFIALFVGALGLALATLALREHEGIHSPGLAFIACLGSIVLVLYWLIPIIAKR